MKTTIKQSFSMAVAMLALCTAFAQTDTIFGTSPRYHYSEIYDTIYYFPDSCTPSPLSLFRIGWYDEPVAKEQFSSESIAVKGISIMVSMNRNSSEPYTPLYTPGSPKLPEYAYLAHYDSDSMYRFSDSLRWDTATPKVMVLPLCRDSEACCNVDCYVYEAFFSKPVIADSFFFIVCTENSNKTLEQKTWQSKWYQYTPTLLTGIHGYDLTNMREFNYSSISTIKWILQNSTVGQGPYKGMYWGGFFPIVDYYNLEARPEEACDSMCTVTGSGRFTDIVPRLITAVPAPGYWFRQWNDGDTTNPRTVFLTQDTLFTATFTASLPCRAVALTQDPTHGTATGSGNYFQGDTVTFTAHPNTGYTLLQWSDGSTRNPYRFTITRDTTVTAVFRQLGSYRVDAESADHSRGFVTGGGTYWELDTATLNAVARPGNNFSHWNDSVTDNPRTIIVMQDTTFTAFFEWIDQHEDISAPDGQFSTLNSQFSITPNPAHNSVTVTIGSQFSIPNSQLSITLTDAAGRELLTLKVQQPKTTIPLGQYPAGTYFLTLRTPDTTSTQRLVIE